MRRTVRHIISISGLAVLLMSTVSTPGLFAAPNEALMASGPPDRRFGVVEAYDAPAAATELGAGWTRVPFLWSQMQPNGAHEWLPPISDEVLAAEIAQGRQPVGLVITTPAWATDVAIGPGVPQGLHTGHNEPNNQWAIFLRRLVTTYAGRIDAWIIWNEPDVFDPNHPGYTWGGSVEDFLQLQRVAYVTIKEANPGATVIFAGTSYWWDAAYGRDLYFRRYLDALIQDKNAPGNNYYCDAVALHLYFQPDFVYSITALYHQLMREHGFDKPVWIVETNAAPSLDPQMPAPDSRFAITLEEQAAYIIQAFAMGIAGGAARISLYKMIDTPTDLAANPEPFGLVRADGSRRPAFNAYRVASTYLAGFQGGQLEQRPEVSIATIQRTSGTTTVLWTRTPSPATVQVPADPNGQGSAILVDMWGQRRTLSASNGVYTVQLPGASCTHGPPCIIGGPPYMIVEGTVDGALTGGTQPAPPPPPPQSAPPSTADAGQVPVDSSPGPTPTPLPKYTVNLGPATVKFAQATWHEQALPGYRMQLVAGPPSYLYILTVVNGVVTAAQRSLEPLTAEPADLLTDWTSAPDTLASTEMTTLHNRRILAQYTVAGLLDRVQHYFTSRPAAPACDIQVAVQLDRDWAFPQRIVERWADDCVADGEPAWLAVITFATLTPTPTATATAPTPTATVTVLPTATRTVPPTATATPTARAVQRATQTRTKAPPLSPTPSAAATSLPPPPRSKSTTSIWMVLVAGMILIGGLLIRRNRET
jgi:hypothetical protein